MNIGVAVFRPIEEGLRTAALLQAKGLAAILAPVVQIIATGEQPKAAAYDGVIATSERAFAGLSDASIAGVAGAPVFVVGARTAAAAVKAGLPMPTVASSDAQALAAAIAERFSPPMRLLYLAGRDRKDALERALSAMGCQIETIATYEASAVRRWSEADIEALSHSRAALHYSNRSAALALGLAHASGLMPMFRSALHVCLSQDAARPLREAGLCHMLVANQPQEDALIDALCGQLKSLGTGR